jgi:hypothetical protein
MHQLEDRRQFGIVQRAAIDVGHDLDAARIEFFHSARNLSNRRLDVVHRAPMRRTREALRIFRDDLGHAVIGDFRHVGRRFRRRHKFDRRHRKRQDLLIVGAELLHHLQPRIQIVKHGNFGPAPDRSLGGDHLHHLVEIGLGEDVRKDVDLFHEQTSSVGWNGGCAGP